MAGLVQKIKDMWTPPEDEFMYDNEFEDVMESEHQDDYDETYMEHRDSRNVKSQSNKVVNINATAQLQVVVAKPQQFGEETRSVADELLKMHTVVLNLENTSKEISRRILDFLSGVAYANNGKIKRVATSTFIITPYNVDLTGDDLMGELENNGLYF
jgi:cell division inhibitor SepF